jgi:hypothetical protein
MDLENREWDANIGKIAQLETVLEGGTNGGAPSAQRVRQLGSSVLV